MCTGVDYNRLSMILAVLEKRLGLNIVNCDAYVNVVGGIKIDEPAADLAIVGAIVSSVGNVPVPAECAFFGEIGLTGEVRAVTHADKRLSEIIRLGFKRCYMPLANKAAVADIEKAELRKEFPAEIRYIGNLKELRY
jgi:DNA repair protein RadA/Sms